MQATIRQFSLTSGVQEGVDPKQLPPGSLLTLVNGVFKKPGRIEKRFGTRAYAALGAAYRLFTRGDELCALDGSNIQSLAGGAWVSRGKYSEVALTWKTIRDENKGVTSSDVALLANGNVVEAWVTGDTTSLAIKGSVYFQVIERATGAIVTPPTLLDSLGLPNNQSALRVRVIATGNSYVIVWSTAGALKSYVAGTITTLKSDGAFSNPSGLLRASFDCMIMGTDWVLAYALDAGGIQLVRYTIAATPALQSQSAVTSETGLGIWAISIDGAVGETLFVTYIDLQTQRVRWACANPSTMAQTLAPTTLQAFTNISIPQIGVRRRTSTTATVVFSLSDNPGYTDGQLTSQTIDTTGNLGPQQLTPFLHLISRPFLMGAREYAFASTATLSATPALSPGITGVDTFLIEVTASPVVVPTTAHREVAKLEVLIGGVWTPGFVATPTSASSSEFLIATPFVSTAASNRGGWRQGVRMVTLTTGASVPRDTWRGVELAGETHLAAGVLTTYDGAEGIGYGWAHAAFIDVSATIAAGVGGTLVTGNYIYNTVPERRSAVGVLHRGPTGIAITKAVTNPQKVTVAVIPPELSLTAYGKTQISIFRSQVNLPTPQKLTLEPSYAVIDNSYNNAPLTYLDGDSDAAACQTIGLAPRPPIYSTGGELDDHQPVAFVTATLHRNRIFGLAGDEQTVWLSKDYSSNVGTAPGFHPTQILYFPERIVVLRSMDDKLVALGEKQPYVVFGDGPASNGQDSDYGTPTPVQSDVGCTNARSVVSMPDGLMFLGGTKGATRGLYLLSRGLEVTYVGAPVEDTLAAFPTITSAVLVARQNQVRFTCNSADGTHGRTIVFDYRLKTWSVFKHWDGGVDGTPIADACMWQNAWTFITPGGTLYQEDETTYRDSGATWVKLSGELAWISEGGPLGYQHIRRCFMLGDKSTPCDFTLKFGFNHNASYAQSYTFTDAQLVVINDGINVGRRVGCQNGASPRCRAFRVAFEDATPTGGGAVGTGQGFNLSAIGFEFIPKPDMDRRGARARA